jgi:sugar diacid utilization regulator
MPPPSTVGGGRQALVAVFEALLGDRRDDEFVRHALRRRVDLRVPHGLLLVCGPDCDPAPLGRVIAGRVARGVVVCVADASPRHAVVVVPSPSRTLWTHAVTIARTEAGARCGLVVVREPVLGLRALRASYFAALADAGLAVAMNLPGPLLDDHELVVPRMLAALPTADQEALLDPLRPILALPTTHRSAYVRTIDALYRHGGTQAAAASLLHLHPNTVRYRMERIEEMTGLRLDDPHDRMRLDLAAMLVVLRGWPPDLHVDRLGSAFRESPDVRFRVVSMSDHNPEDLSAAAPGADRSRGGRSWPRGDLLGGGRDLGRPALAAAGC